MDPCDFLAVVDALKNSSQEAEIRTAISRAYYAVFNYIRSYLTANNLDLPNYRIHHRLPLCIRNSGVQGSRDVAQNVEDLRDDRLDADYDMQLTGWNPDMCALLADKARETINDFRACQGPELVSGARNYLVNVLRLIL